MSKYKLFRKDRQRGKHAFWAKKLVEWREICLGTHETPDMSLWARIRGQTNTGDILVGS